MTDIADREKRFQSEADKLRAAADKFNDAIASCFRSGLIVELSTVDASVPGDDVVRPVVQVEIFKLWRY